MRSLLQTDFFDPPRPRVIAHRGASGDYPENTLASFAAARDAGAPYLELDVHMSRDGVIVVAHDEDLARVAGNPAVIRENDYAGLRTIDAGFNFKPPGTDAYPFRGKGIYVPTLAEVFAACPEQLYIVEIKQADPSLAAPLLEVIVKAGMRRRVLIASEHQRPIGEFRALAQDVPTNFPTPEIAAFLMALPPGAPPFTPRGDALQIPPTYQGWKMVTPESVAAAHRIGAEVHVWTINDEHEMRAMLSLGVDGIITNFPARLQALI
ncbi:MAG: glycerophosphodiester phosphodiesterase [Candidatus Binataceae bacterium]|jgi:glycerophosphoryl diester phosphodiesterase